MQDFRATIAAHLSALTTCPEAEVRARARALVAPDATWHLSAPMGEARGPDAMVDGLFLPLREAFSGCHRRDLLVIGGENRCAEGGRWLACLTHYVGTFVAPFCGLAPSGRLAFLRSGEFYRIDEGRITRPINQSLRSGRISPPRRAPSLNAARPGYEIVFPAPATRT